MLDFSTQPPIEATRSPYRLVRTPAKGQLELLITAEQLLGCYTHFFGGRTVPCTGEPCDACQAGSSMRWHGYVSAVTVKDQEPILFEVTAAAAEQLANYRAKIGTLRGCQCLAARVAARPNARVKLRMKPADLSRVELPKGFNVIAALCHVWGIPATDTSVQTEPKARSSLHVHVPGPPTDKAAPNGQGRPELETQH